MTFRAEKYYNHFLAIHDGDPDLALRAKFGLQRLGLPLPPKDGGLRPANHQEPQVLKANLVEGEPITDAIFAEFIAGNVDTSAVTSREIGKASQLHSLKPITHLKKLRILDLHEAGQIRELAPLSHAHTLKTLRLRGLGVTEAQALGDLKLVETLELSGAKNLTDFAFLAQMKRLRHLNLNGCKLLADLSVLENLKDLEKLSIESCTSVHNLEPLSHLTSLTHLDLRNIGQIKDIKPLADLRQLKTLNLNGVKLPHPDDVDWLKARLSKCKITR